MKTIDIFLASSITELLEEREKLYKYLSGKALRGLFRNDNIDIQLVNCEYFEEGYRGTPSQRILDVSLEECPISIFLFKAKNKEDAKKAVASAQKKGKGTEEEFDVALRCAKEKRHTMFIYFLVGSKRNRTKAFNEYIESEMNRNGIYATICSNIDEVNSSVIIRLLKYEHEWLCAIGEKYKRNSVSLQDKTKIDVTWKDGIDLYGLYSWHNDKREEIQPLIHSAIGNIMKSIKREIDSKSNKYRAGAMENSHIIRVYNDVSLWAEKTKYEIEKHCELLSNYKDFLNKIRQYNSAEDIHLKYVKLIEEKNGLDSLVTADEYKKIGLIFFQHKKYENAIKYLKDAMKIYESNTEKDNREMQVIQILISEARKHIEGLGGKKKSYIATIDS